MTIIEFLSHYYILIIFGAIVVLVVIRIIYNAIRPSKRSKAKELMGKVANMYDPITGLPRNVVDKNHEAFVEEYEEKEHRVTKIREMAETNASEFGAQDEKG